MKDAMFIFSDECIQAFNILKDTLTTTLVIIASNWNLDFKLMCDASDYTVRAILGQRIDKKFRLIYYASKTMNETQEHYTTTEKELLAVVYAFDKFQSYLIVSKTVVYTDHSALKYLFNKQDSKPRLIREPNADPWTEYKLPIRSTPFMIIYRKACHLPIEIDHRAYWALRNVNLDLDAAGKHRTKHWHDAKIMDKEFHEGEEVLVFNSRLKPFP
ncbi:reverse transcriptase domain-containing protein [Tanacetum coccineum]